jgi:hypothetical protein
MRRIVLGIVLVLAVSAQAFAQSAAREAELRRAAPYSEMARQIPGLTLRDYEDAVRAVASGQVADTPVAEVPRYTAPSPRSVAPTHATPSYAYRPPSYAAPAPTSRYTYDTESGNSYSTRRRPNGDTVVNGFNYNTGSAWNTTIKPNGSMNGTDSALNPWTYDGRSGTYTNFGTGVTCFGKGALRTCY